MPFELISFPDAESLAKEAARRFLEKIKSHAPRKEKFIVALSGGRITKTFFQNIVEQAKETNEDFTGVSFFWADERCVPPDHPESNYRLARSLLLDPLGIAEEKVFRVKGELPPPQAAAEAQSRLFEVARDRKDGQPVTDLLLLGMGEDGHVASLFPDADPRVTESRETYISVIGPKPPPQRITLTYPAIIAAREVWVLASGVGKEDALRRSLAKEITTPLGRVLHSRKSTVVFTDIKQS